MQGALVGCLCGILVNTWICVGRMTMNIQDATLPLTSVDRCPASGANASLPWQQLSNWTTASAVTLSYDVTTPLSSIGKVGTCPQGRNFLPKGGGYHFPFPPLPSPLRLPSVPYLTSLSFRSRGGDQAADAFRTISAQKSASFSA